MKTVDELDESELILPSLHQAARQRDVEKAKSLLASGMDVNQLDDRKPNGDGGNSPLWYAAQGIPAGGIDVVRVLVQAGADINARGEFGMTPLHMACSWGHFEVVRFLHEHGADVTIRDTFGRTPIELARADYEEGKAAPEEGRPEGFAVWLQGMAAINAYFAEVALQHNREF